MSNNKIYKGDNNFHNFPHLVANIILSVAFTASFIVIFFFTYVSEGESGIVIANTKYTISEIVDNMIILLPDNIKKLFQNINLPIDKDGDKKVSDNNAVLKTKAFTYIGIFLLVAIILSFLILQIKVDGTFNIYKLEYMDFFSVLIENFGLLIFVGLTEFLFFKFVISKYVSSNPNVIKSTILSLIQKYTKQINKNN